jgi:hypothetical protein
MDDKRVGPLAFTESVIRSYLLYVTQGTYALPKSATVFPEDIRRMTRSIKIVIVGSINHNELWPSIQITYIPDCTLFLFSIQTFLLPPTLQPDGKDPVLMTSENFCPSIKHKFQLSIGPMYGTAGLFNFPREATLIF